MQNSQLKKTFPYVLHSTSLPRLLSSVFDCSRFMATYIDLRAGPQRNVAILITLLWRTANWLANVLFPPLQTPAHCNTMPLYAIIGLRPLLLRNTG